MPDSGIFQGSHPLGVNLAAALKLAREGDPHADPVHKIAYPSIFRMVGDALWMYIKAEHAYGMHAIFTDTSLAALRQALQAQFRAYAANEWPFTRPAPGVSILVIDWWRALAQSPHAKILAVRA
jgi:hypothetical protein